MARHQLSVSEKVWLVKQMYQLEYPTRVQRLWRSEMKTEPPSRPTINAIMNKFEETGSVLNLLASGRPVSVTDESMEEEISSILETDPQTSPRRMSSLLNVSRTSIQRVYERMGFKAYVPRLVHQLNEDDFDRRIEFCETFLSLLNDEPDLIDRVIWSDEAIFKLNGQVNRHNSVYWARENPNVIWEQSAQAAGVVIWAGVWAEGVIGPFFFEESVTGQSYLAMLNDFFYPVFRRLPNRHSIFLMQDGASPHYAKDVREWLDQKFRGQWIGRRGPIEWPARSPDLSPADFFLWGYVKDIVYKTEPHSLIHLKQLISSAFQNLDSDLCKKACESVPKRLQQCIDADGHQFEHLK